MIRSEPTDGHRISGFQKKQCPWGMKSERKKREKKSMGGPPGGGLPGRHDPWARALEACAGVASLRWRADGKASTRWDAVSAEEWACDSTIGRLRRHSEGANGGGCGNRRERA